jgi:hypothetical protein
MSAALMVAALVSSFLGSSDLGHTPAHRAGWGVPHEAEVQVLSAPDLTDDDDDDPHVIEHSTSDAVCAPVGSPRIAGPILPSAWTERSPGGRSQRRSNTACRAPPLGAIPYHQLRFSRPLAQIRLSRALLT